jgi:hypothetical protein
MNPLELSFFRAHFAMFAFLCLAFFRKEGSGATRESGSEAIKLTIMF